MNGTIGISMQTKYIVIVIITILFLSIATLIGSILTINKISEDNIQNYKNDVYLKTQKELQNYVQVTLQTIDSFYKRSSKEKIKHEVKTHLQEQMGLLFSVIKQQYISHKDKMSEDELKEHIKNLIKAIRYGENGYFWVNDLDSKMIMHPIESSLNDQDLSTFTDENGRFIFNEFSKLAKEKNEGFVSYVWSKPGDTKSQEKISLIKLFKEFSWVIGTGDYVEDVSAKLKEEAIKTISQIRYGNNGYFWINNSEPRMIMHPIKKELNGKDLSLVQDKNGMYLFKEFVKITNEKRDGAIVKYLWSKPGFKDAQPKFSYVQKFEPWDWIVGTGAYVDDVELKVKQMKQKTKKSINVIIIASAIIFIVVLVAISLITLAISSKDDSRRV